MLQNVQHQIVQSPARLGIPTPNSPNPTPPKPTSSHPTPPHPPTPPPTSSTLLTLLPPLPRAQSLLLQISALTSKLFEVGPTRSNWVSSFRGSLPTFLPSSSPPPQTSSIKETLTLIKDLQSQLFDSVAELQEILDLQDVKQKLNKEIKSLDSNLLNFANKLKESERILDILVDDYSDYHRNKRVKPMDTDSNHNFTLSTQLKLSDILSYAHKISYTTFAPPEFGAGQAPLRGSLPPAPQDEQMRASQLYHFANLDVGIKTEEDTKRVEMFVESSSRVDPVSFPVPPPGWKPGMPVELPMDIPLPPPGWKPGDPIALPPMVVPAREPPRMVVPPSLKGPEPIQVRHVQLDIEDSDSDYSSDEASSDSED